MRREYYQKYEPTPTSSIKPKIKSTPEPDSSSAAAKIKPQNNIVGDFFKNFGYDEILITALIIAFATDDEPDFLTVFALIFILLT